MNLCPRLLICTYITKILMFWNKRLHEEHQRYVCLNNGMFRRQVDDKRKVCSIVHSIVHSKLRGQSLFQSGEPKILHSRVCSKVQATKEILNGKYLGHFSLDLKMKWTQSNWIFIIFIFILNIFPQKLILWKFI